MNTYIYNIEGKRDDDYIIEEEYIKDIERLINESE